MNEVAKPIRKPDRFTQLLQRPRRSRMRRDVDVQQLPRCMMDEYEDVQGSKRRCDCFEEVTRDDRLRVIAKKSRPTLIASRATRQPLRHVLSGDSVN